MTNPPSINAGNLLRKRPGPFGPAWALLPKDQEPMIIPEATLASDAIERMVDYNFSQLPIKNKEGRITGVFTWQSFGKRVSDLANTKIKALELPVKEAREQARFIDPDAYIDTETDWSQIDYVLVGTDERLLGILCISDALGRLNDFAEAFVILYEVETELRDLVCEVVAEAKLREMLASMRLPPHIPQPLALEECTFNQYRLLICSRRNWVVFEPVFATMREVMNADLEEITELRNIIFHFRRGITTKDIDRLRRFRDRRRWDREVHLLRSQRTSTAAY